MTLPDILYSVFAALAVLSALLAVTRKNAVAAACWLVVMFFGLAGVFVLEEAFFVATTQILVYAGAIMVLFLFVIMLLDLRSVELAAHQGPKLKFAGVVLAGVFLAAVLHAVADAEASSRIADRVAAVLRRPALPEKAGAPSDPSGKADGSAKGDELFEAAKRTPPSPEPVELSGERPSASESHGKRDGDRSFGGTLLVDAPGALATAGTSAPRVEKRVRVTILEPAGDVSVSVDGTALPLPKWDPDDATASERHATYSVPGAADGTKLDVTVVRGGLSAAPSGGPDGSPRAIGRAIFEEWLLPFEVASVLLTGAIFGAVVLTKRRLS